MLRLFPILAIVLVLLPATGAHSHETGFRQTTIDSDGSRPLHVSLWYPTNDAGSPKLVGENAVFQGIPAIADAASAPGPHPLVVLSHGYGGSWRNLNWLARTLVDHGYAVAAPDHPGTTTFDRDPAKAAMLGERPRDLSRTISFVLAKPDLVGRIDPSRIAAIGHSLGGWTAMALGGARFDGARFSRDCRANASLRACALSGELGLTDPALGEDFRDARVRALVSLDLGVARGFTPESLAAMTTPTLVLGAGVDIGDMPVMLESGWIAQFVQKDRVRLVVVPDAMHFSFMQICKPGGAAAIEAEEPGEGIVCRDGGKRRREVIHQEVASQILDFLATALPAR